MCVNFTDCNAVIAKTPAVDIYRTSFNTVRLVLLLTGIRSQGS